MLDSASRRQRRRLFTTVRGAVMLLAAGATHHQGVAFSLLSQSQRTRRTGFNKQQQTLLRVQPLFDSSGSVDHDFSSKYFWEDFYQKQLGSLHSEEDEDPILENKSKNDNDNPAFVYEWHDSVSLQDLAALIPIESNCLMVGCGNSYLPQVVLDRDDNIHMTLLDTSQTCLEQLEAQYGTEDVSFVCGSATEMASYFVDTELNENEQLSTTTATTHDYFDIIVDKGLTDAFMCGEGWETPVEALLRESSKVIDPDRGGVYLLISYKMGPAIQRWFQQKCDAVSDDIVWEWDFDMEPLSNHRVSVSVANVRPRGGAP